jgi:DNA-damage-inducible protein D
MKKELILRLHAQFEEFSHREGNLEFWFARDLQVLLGYSRWENFKNAIDRAKTACERSDQRVEDHFPGVTKMVDLGSGSQREIEDIALTRYACYLIAQNGDPIKPEIAFAQTYFALQTRKQELIEQRLAEVERIQARSKLKISEKELSSIIFEKLKEDSSFARIRSKGDKALFGGNTTQNMKYRLGVPSGRALADFLPTITIKAKDFANEITNFNIRKDELKTEQTITDEHIKSNRDVRKVLTDRNIRPEELPPAEDAEKVARRLISDQKKMLSKSKRKPGKNHK